MAYVPDDSVWLRDLAFNDPYAKYYSHHEAFKPYPVVGVSFEAANAYCDYMTATQGTVRLRGIDNKWRTVKVRYRLPTESEWMVAAGVRMQVDSVNRQTFQSFYPGRIYYPRDHKGHFRFNHKLGKGDYAGWAGGKGFDYEGYMITAPALSFPPDEFLGLHNLAGNVAEMTSTKGIAKGGSWAHLQDDCRSEAVNTFERPMAWLGFRVVAEVVE
jgi:formylglycine-generating enzyme required for sulfatase activity